MKASCLRLLSFSASVTATFAANAIAADEVYTPQQRKVCNQISNAAHPVPRYVNPLADDDKAKSGQTAKGVMADPQEYEGRSCRVRWQRRSENVPDPTQIDVLLCVDWQ